MVNKIDLMNFEKKYKLAEKELFGIRYWDYIRMNFLNDIKSKANKIEFIADFNK